MDETLKVIIATLSGFLVAFLSEPVKMYFQNLISIQNLRKALYHEMFSNYSFLGIFFDDTNTEKKKINVRKVVFKGASRHNLRTEYYKYAISQNAHLFYQLEEARFINLLYGYVSGLMESIHAENNRDPQPEPLIEGYRNTFKVCMEDGTFNKTIMTRVIGKKAFDSIKQ